MTIQNIRDGILKALGISSIGAITWLFTEVYALKQTAAVSKAIEEKTNDWNRKRLHDIEEALKEIKIDIKVLLQQRK